jgi:hypothetical protein
LVDFRAKLAALKDGHLSRIAIINQTLNLDSAQLETVAARVLNLSTPEPISTLGVASLSKVVDELDEMARLKRSNTNRYSIILQSDDAEQIKCVAIHVAALAGHIPGVRVSIIDGETGKEIPLPT